MGKDGTALPGEPTDPGHGQGIAFLPDRTAAPTLADGRLILVLEEWRPAIPGLLLSYPGHRQVPPPLRAFVDVLREMLP